MPHQGLGNIIWWSNWTLPEQRLKSLGSLNRDSNTKPQPKKSCIFKSKSQSSKSPQKPHKIKSHSAKTGPKQQNKSTLMLYFTKTTKQFKISASNSSSKIAIPQVISCQSVKGSNHKKDQPITDLISFRLKNQNP